MTADLQSAYMAAMEAANDPGTTPEEMADHLDRLDSFGDLEASEAVRRTCAARGGRLTVRGVKRRQRLWEPEERAQPVTALPPAGEAPEATGPIPEPVVAGPAAKEAEQGPIEPPKAEREAEKIDAERQVLESVKPLTDNPSSPVFPFLQPEFIRNLPAVGGAGPMGPPGPPGPAAPTTFEALCGMADEVGMAVYVSGPKAGDLFQVTRADPTDEDKMPAVAIIVSKESAISCHVQFSGPAPMPGGLTVGQIYYVGLTGHLVDTPPVAAPGGIVVQQAMGVALDPAELALSPASVAVVEQNG